jgi:hypothetical protein
MANILLSGYCPTEYGREKVFRTLRQIKKRVGYEKAYETCQENLRGYMVFVEGVVLTPENIKELDKMRAESAFAYMPYEFPWRNGCIEVCEVDEDGFRSDGSIPIFEPDWDFPKTRSTPQTTKEAIIEAAQSIVATSNLAMMSSISQ